MTHVVAVDWSGRAKGAAETIWLARVEGGQLRELENGLDRDGLVQRVIQMADDDPRLVVGLDFAFSFPASYASKRGWTSHHQVWEAMKHDAEPLLAACEPPFWGRPGKKRPSSAHHDAYRETDTKVDANPKSVFQIGGAGAVGTGSLRGMEHLATLAAAGFSIWPFDEPSWPRVIEIYPRLFTGGVVKSRHRARRQHLAAAFPDQDPVLLERAAGSEDAFDAAVSALVMAKHLSAIEALTAAEPGSLASIEGTIWAPPQPSPT